MWAYHIFWNIWLFNLVPQIILLFSWWGPMSWLPMAVSLGFGCCFCCFWLQCSSSFSPSVGPQTSSAEVQDGCASFLCWGDSQRLWGPWRYHWSALWLNAPQYHLLSAAFTPVGAGHHVKQVKWFQTELGISSCFSKTTSSSAWSFHHLSAHCHLEVKPRAL